MSSTPSQKLNDFLRRQAEKLKLLEETVEILRSEIQEPPPEVKFLNLPQSQLAGAVLYKGCLLVPRKFTTVLLTEVGQQPYGLSEAVCRGTWAIQLAVPTFARSVSFSLRKNPTAEAAGLIGANLPISAKRVTTFDPLAPYPGRDFEAQLITTDGTDYNTATTGAQESWLASSEFDSDDAFGYRFACEFMLRPNVTLAIRARPLSPTDPFGGNQQYTLSSYLHVYQAYNPGQALQMM